MEDADVGLGWVDASGKLYFEVRDGRIVVRCIDLLLPRIDMSVITDKTVLDETTQDWFGLQGREENGWTAIQFKRLIDTCDKLDVRIKVRPSTTSLSFTFSYTVAILGRNEHSHLCVWSRRSGDVGTRGQTLITTAQIVDTHVLFRSNPTKTPPPESKFADLDSFDYQFNNVSVSRSLSLSSITIHSHSSTSYHRIQPPINARSSKSLKD